MGAAVVGGVSDGVGLNRLLSDEFVSMGTVLFQNGRSLEMSKLTTKSKMPRRAKPPRRKKDTRQVRIAAEIDRIQQLPLENPQAAAMAKLLNSWLSDESGYDEKTWPKLKKSLDEERQRVGARRLFDE